MLLVEHARVDADLLLVEELRGREQPGALQHLGLKPLPQKLVGDQIVLGDGGDEAGEPAASLAVVVTEAHLCAGR